MEVFDDASLVRVGDGAVIIKRYSGCIGELQQCLFYKFHGQNVILLTILSIISNFVFQRITFSAVQNNKDNANKKQPINCNGLFIFVTTLCL